MPRVNVGIRFKPEQSEQTLRSLTFRDATGKDGKVVEISVSGQKNEFNFDNLFDGETNQEEVFKGCAVKIIEEVIEGYNGCIFAYGAGKTHTMSGPESNSYAERGLCMRSAGYLFERARQIAPDVLTIRLSVLEIYNEMLIDLLKTDAGSSVITPSYSSSMAPVKTPSGPTNYSADATTSSSQKLTIVDTATGVMIPALYVLPLSSEEDAYTMLLEAYSNRVVAEHQLNRRSSRSHVIYTFYVTRSRTGVPSESTDDDVVQSKLHLVDLAGSERVEKTGSTGTVQKEANHINRSLSFLEQVVIALTQSKRDHIPYRQSKLTYILKDSLGGNSNTYMIACVWPHMSHSWETLSTLRFASRMSCIENAPVRNSLATKEHASARLLQQIEALKKELVMRDVVAGAEPWLPVLSRSQRDRTVLQAADFALAAPSTSDPLTPSVGDEMRLSSLSQARLLTGVLRALIWEACGNDEVRVGECVRRVIPPHLVQQSKLGSGSGSTSARRAHYPIEEGDGNGNDDEDGDGNREGRGEYEGSGGGEGSRRGDFSARGSADKGFATVTPSPSTPITNPQGGHGGGGARPGRKIGKSKSGDGPRSQPEVNSSENIEGDGGGGDGSGSGRGVSSISIEEFQRGAGAELHAAFEDVKAALKTNKTRQREIIQMINQIKARIDTCTEALRAAKAKVKAQMAQRIDGDGDGDGDGEHGSGYGDEGVVDVEEVAALRASADEAKREYRGAHAELQMCKRQVAELESLKQRSLAALVQSFDEYCKRASSGAGAGAGAGNADANTTARDA